MLTEKNAKGATNFNCDYCDFKCSKKSNYEKHLNTNKHSINISLTTKKTEEFHTCSKCSKNYKSRVGLWYHIKKCQTTECTSDAALSENTQSSITVLTNLVLEVVKNNSELLKENQEFKKQNYDLQKQILDVCQKIQPTTINNTNSHNKTFNLQLFLNEQCKDAMNIMDFVNTFQLQFSDFERIGEVGYVEGISHIVINKLNEMDIHKRPIHCSDGKREIMYVKDKDVWAKENANNDKIRLALKHITKKNSDMIRPWAIAHPGVLNSDHRLSDKYQEMIIEAMGGNSGTIKECETKIIKKISKMVLIDKGQL